MKSVSRVIAVCLTLLVATACAFGTPAPAPTAAPPKPAETKPAPPPAAAPTSAPAIAPTSAPAAKPAPFAVPSTPVTLNVWWTTHPEQGAYMKESVIPRFTRKYPNVTVQFETVANAQIEQKVLTAMAGGGGPDVWWAFDYSVAPYVSRNLLATIEPAAYGLATQEELVATYLPNTLAGYTFNGKLYGLPHQMNSFSLYLNLRHFKEAGLDPDKDAPKTWDDVIALAKKLTKTDANGRITRHGFRWSVGNPTWTYYQIVPIIQQLGGDVLDADNKCIANSEAGVKAVQFRNAFVAEYKTEDPAVTLNTPPAPLDDLVKEATAMYLSSSGASDPWIRSGNPDLYNNKLYKAVPTPQFNPAKPATIAYAQSPLISARSSPDKQAVAQAFVQETLANPVDWLVKVGGVISPKKSLRDTPEAKAYPFMDVFLTDLERGRFVPRHAQYPEIRDAFHRAVDRVVLNKEDAKKSLDQFCGDVNRALGNR